MWLTTKLLRRRRELNFNLAGNGMDRHNKVDSALEGGINMGGRILSSFFWFFAQHLVLSFLFLLFGSYHLTAVSHFAT
jgi:hypothetical protein